MKWFKFYGQDFLTDPKIVDLDPLHKLIWIILLCLADSETGKIKHLSIYSLLRLAGTDDNTLGNPTDYERTKDVLKLFTKLKMITIDNENDNVITVTLVNYIKRQNLGPMTDYERVKKYREKKKLENNFKLASNDNDDNEMITSIRQDKIRQEYIIPNKNVTSSNEDVENISFDDKKRKALKLVKSI